MNEILDEEFINYNLILKIKEKSTTHHNNNFSTLKNDTNQIFATKILLAHLNKKKFQNKILRKIQINSILMKFLSKRVIILALTHKFILKGFSSEFKELLY